MSRLTGTEAMGPSAVFSRNRIYRYVLRRLWDAALPSLNVIGLNPSIADETVDDPTIRRCVDFARRLGYGSLVMTNLFAFRATSPQVLKIATAPVGRPNDARLLLEAGKADAIVAAWGVHGGFRSRDVEVRQLLKAFDLHCLGTTASGHPRHPSRLAANTALRRFR